MLTDREQRIVDWVRTRKMATMRHLQHQFQVCHMTVFRALKKYGYYSSYNHNAGYYTLADVPEFEEANLINYDFAKYGTPAVRDGLIKRWTEQVFPLPK